MVHERAWRLRRQILLVALLCGAAASCAADGTDEQGSEVDDTFGPDQIVGADAVGRRLALDGHVLVPEGQSTSETANVVRAQVRVLFGAFHARGIGLSERTPIINTASFRRELVTVVDPAAPNATPRRLWRVRYTYRSRAVVPRSLANTSTIATTTLFGDYRPYTTQIAQMCFDAEARDAGVTAVWYHFDPTQPRCARAIADEIERIHADRRSLAEPARQIVPLEVQRRFLPVSAHLERLEGNEAAYPEYHRMYADGRLVVYSFFGLDKANDPNDYGGRNYFAFLRTLLREQPLLRVTAVSGGENLLGVSWQGRRIGGVTYERVFRWVLDRRDYPREVGYSERDAFRLQILRQWRDHYVTLGMNATLRAGNTTRPVTVEIRTYYGDEENAAEPAAVRRYIAAFADADVFQYSGHSHLGYGPLDPWHYRPSHFPDRYQLFMVNSCASFNYYNDFFRLHPGGTRNLDTVTNGVEVYLRDMGISSGRFVLAMIDGRFRSYLEILTGMQVDLPWERDHDPQRVADGELDNVYSPARFPMSLTTAR